ncbi:enoyl-CoA hydratase-related protein [Haloglycomyces albus]|uniref:enoyl-CoA hydratase-related protein n=1 Tax=Haloglycomyces albus TaxID=526067 RepID=UPI001FE20AA9|nr:enoyl-CoA hydratase-related protein [Haloglycomyces albus]
MSAFNGLTQRAWCHLREEGHTVGVELAPTHTDESMTELVRQHDPDLILCPFLKHRVPESVWGHYPTVIVHPGPAGDRGPSSLDHAILDERVRWGVTALSAIEAMDAGPIWSSHNFTMPSPPISKSALYNSHVADAAMACIDDVVATVAQGNPRPTPPEVYPREIPDTGERPLLRRKDFAIDWSDTPEEICRRIAAADGAPGAPAVINGRDYCLFDATHEDITYSVRPGTVVARDGDRIAVGANGGLVWVGYAAKLTDNKRGIKQPAGHVISVGGVPSTTLPHRNVPEELSETDYQRIGDVGVLTIRSYNGAMHTEQCERITTAVEKALTESTHTLVVTGTEHCFSNGIHLGAIEAAVDPAQEAWNNINAIDDLCAALAEARQLTVASISTNAGAGGVMTALAADVVYAREGAVLNPYYDMGLYGSELHSWSLPARVGLETAHRLLNDKLPVSARRALDLGLVDAVGPRQWDSYVRWLTQRAQALEDDRLREQLRHGALARRSARPLTYHRTLELAEMARDFYDNRNGFAEKRRDFVFKRPASETPPHLRFA